MIARLVERVCAGASPESDAADEKETVTTMDGSDRRQSATERHEHVTTSRSQLGPQDGQRQAHETLIAFATGTPVTSSSTAPVPIHPRRGERVRSACNRANHRGFDRRRCGLAPQLEPRSERRSRHGGHVARRSDGPRWAVGCGWPLGALHRPTTRSARRSRSEAGPTGSSQLTGSARATAGIVPV